MQTPHESLLLNEKRGLLAAVTGNPAFYPGIVDLYDLNEDCRNPALQSSLPVGIFGHESGFAPDGNTFYATSISTGNITAVDVSNPKLPMIVATTNYNSHGLTISDDGNRAYVAASQGLFILDTSEIQARKQGAQFKEVSKLDWATRTIPQVAHPITIGGHPYLAEIDEFSSAENDDSTSPPTGRRSAPRGSSTSPTRRRRRWSPTSASRSTRRRTARRSPTTRARRASCRATRATTATSRAARTRRSSPAR